jgi:hypothetical protein
MPNLQTDERVTDDAWEKARDADEADGCAAGRAHDRPGAICRRGSQCHCARPIGHPVPVDVPHGREPRR